ncbi:M48 family metallopeptidase [Roseicyclus sp.]|uniref:M48 family metallopeptidase n=1 Tax=Roseicyclus sp. TaxID=1914329 RepID=UPI003F6D92A7
MTTKRPSTHVLPGDPPVEIALKRSTRATRFSLRVSRADGRVSLSLPIWAPEGEALAFLRDREAWLRGHLANAAPSRHARIGAWVPICGTPREVIAAATRATRFRDGRIEVPDGPRAGPRIRALLGALARERLTEAVERHAAALGRKPQRITLRDPRSRWGSCSSKGDLMFSWRLIMAPPAVLDYVAAHEVAHLVEMNHSAAFWRVCARLRPDYDAHRAWLRQHGASLLAWRFETAQEEP